MIVHWVRFGAGVWHAWVHGNEGTVCQRFNKISLGNGKRLAMQHERPTTGRVCGACSGRLGVSAPTPSHAGSAAGQRWAGHIRRYLVGLHARAPKAEDVDGLADLLAGVGSPEDADAQEVWYHIRQLLLNPGRHGVLRNGLHDALAKLQEPGALAKVADALKRWHLITGRTPARDRYSAAQVVTVMLQVPDVAPYVKHLKDRGLEHLAAVFHPNTLERARKDGHLRGTFRGGSAYFAGVKDRLTVVSE